MKIDVAMKIHILTWQSSSGIVVLLGAFADLDNAIQEGKRHQPGWDPDHWNLSDQIRVHTMEVK